ncbi:MAG TPA: CoA-transferase [Solirubrobacteraceae bacterium]|nr:CoA-transferase [Solirubrobacteraceae bacterium]
MTEVAARRAGASTPAAAGGGSSPLGAEQAGDATPVELMTIAGSRLLRDGKVVFAGVGAPLEASVLARRLHAPSLTIVLEGGSIGPTMLPGLLPVSTNEMRAAHGASMLTSICDLFLYGQRGHYDYGFIGAGQLDQYGNVNTSFIGDPERPRVRLPGSGGANDIVSSCREILIMTRHEPRRFVERVDFITSPGYLSGGDARRRAGLVRSRPVAVITDLALLGFDERTGRLRLDALQPGVSESRVRESTGFELLVSESLAELAPPTRRELNELRRLRDGDPAREGNPARDRNPGRDGDSTGGGASAAAAHAREVTPDQ